MKKLFIIFCILLCCTSNIFARHKNHHRGEKVYTGYEYVSNIHVGKIKHIVTSYPSMYKPNDYVLYKNHESEYEYSGCHCNGFDYNYTEIIRIATKKEIKRHYLNIFLIILGIIGGFAFLCVLVCIDDIIVAISSIHFSEYNKPKQKSKKKLKLNEKHV